MGYKDPPKHSQFKKGQGGRPKGARNKIGEAFLADLLEDWESHGKDAIEAMREQRPHEYVKVVASLLPKQLNVQRNELEDLTDDQLNTRVLQIAEELGFEELAALFGTPRLLQ